MLRYTLNVSDDFFVTKVSLNAEKEAQDANVGFFLHYHYLHITYESQPF